MSYGQNQPWGLQAIKTITGATWNGQTSPYLIQSGYVNNIFKGDLVYLGEDGYIHSITDAGIALQYQTYQAIGVFNGCSFRTSTATNPIDPSSPGRSYWPGGTVTFNNQDATCDIIDDPNVIFNIQSDLGGVPFNAQGATASVVAPFVGATRVVSGNFNTGASSMVLGSSTINVNAPAANLRILRFVATPGNLPGIPFNNVEVLIQNHSFMQRAAGI